MKTKRLQKDRQKMIWKSAESFGVTAEWRAKATYLGTATLGLLGLKLNHTKSARQPLATSASSSL